MIFHPEQFGILDYGSYYAAKTQPDEHGNRILWGWITETRPVGEYRAAGWAGMMSLPRVLRLDQEGRLRIEVSPAMHVLRRREQVCNLRLTDTESAEQLNAMSVENCCGEFRCILRSGREPLTLSLVGTLARTELPDPLVRTNVDPRSPTVPTTDFINYMSANLPNNVSTHILTTYPGAGGEFHQHTDRGSHRRSRLLDAGQPFDADPDGWRRCTLQSERAGQRAS